MNVITDSITFVAKYDSLNNPDHKTFITIRGRSEKSNTYFLDTNVCIHLYYNCNLIINFISYFLTII